MSSQLRIGNPVGIMFGIAFDITEKKQAQDALQEMRAELARNARINQMVAMTGSIAHEINQPLSAIVANASAGLRWLERTTPDVDETRTVLQGSSTRVTAPAR